GMVKLEELVATRFQLSLGSFKLKYEDTDGDMILIAGDLDLIELVADYRQPDNQTVIRLLVLPTAHQSPVVQVNVTGLQASGGFVVNRQHRYTPSEPDSKYIYQVAQVKVKATFEDDMINFRFPISSGLLTELENQVALRF
ncbi:NLP3-like protein, partial [Tanacetum coccineum]